GGLSVRPVDDDRIAGGDLSIHLRNDQPEPSRREAPGRGQPPVENRKRRGQAERRASRPVTPDPRTHKTGSRACVRESRRREPVAASKNKRLNEKEAYMAIAFMRDSKTILSLLLVCGILLTSNCAWMLQRRIVGKWANKDARAITWEI